MHNNTEVQTPKNKLRSLGLKRSIQKSSANKIPLSDVKINYKSLQTEAATETSSPFTPRLSQTVAVSASAHTTNSLPYRLSLSRRVRDKYKKKKLEFAASHPEGDLDSPLDIRQEIAQKEKILVQHQKHKEKVQELKGVIAIWAEAFKTSLEELSSKIDPKMEVEDLIARLGIPSNMIDYT